MSHPYKNCTELSAACPIEGTLYGYYPNVPANLAYAAIFVICLIVQLILGIRYKTWSYMFALGVGCFLELIGYIGRIQLHHNPWSKAALAQQLVTLVVAPAFLAAGIYLTLKHVVIAIEPKLSRLRPTLYTWIFVMSDVISIFVQAAGAAISSKSTTSVDKSLSTAATNVLLTGVILQVITLVIFGILAGIYATSVYRYHASLQVRAIELLQSRKFKCFVAGISAAYLFILVRCAYRIGEMAGGWKNPIMRDQTEFMILDGLMCVLAALCMTIFHPGICFPQMRKNAKAIRVESSNGEGHGSDLELGRGHKLVGGHQIG